MARNSDTKRTRRNLLTGLSATVLAGGLSAGSVSSQSEQKPYEEAVEVLDETGSRSKFEEALEDKGIRYTKESMALGRSELETLTDDGQSPIDMDEVEDENGDLEVLNSSTVDKDWAQFDIYLYERANEDGYVAQATWSWEHQVLPPQDVVALTYKEDAWWVPDNGYDSGAYVDLDGGERSANGYAWEYDAESDTRSDPGTTRWANLELNPLSDQFDSSSRQVWMSYAANYGIYGYFAHIDSIQLGFGALSVDLGACFRCTSDVWIEDNDGDELKVSVDDVLPHAY